MESTSLETPEIFCLGLLPQALALTASPSVCHCLLLPNRVKTVNINKFICYLSCNLHAEYEIDSQHCLQISDIAVSYVKFVYRSNQLDRTTDRKVALTWTNDYGCEKLCYSMEIWTRKSHDLD